ncbi:DUF4345 family protein [Mycolicibacterium aichiense]|uniref:DUF4345 family protein n=1 Tax=Mycolicibacterium aichiense TaxID=1799 RepID=UPI000E025F01|nr:DUF4345 family protein [Mycolicibacterium aichiense]MCV7016592.1 DUF4345 family protein [Mycolicibacterium aichiense]SUA14194.1 Uncharacterised protein [Mycolicibacterium aichiense]
MSPVVITIVAVFFLGMGLYGLAAPASLIEPFGIVLERPEARAEVRAVYGGFGVAVGGVLGYGLLQPQVRTGIVLAVAVALAGMAFGRVIAALCGDRTPFYPNWFYCLVEVAAAAALALVIT